MQTPRRILASVFSVALAATSLVAVGPATAAATPLATNPNFQPRRAVIEHGSR